MEPKQQLTEFRERLYNMRNEPIAQTVRLIADLELAKLDDRLRRCTQEELPGLQGEVRTWLTIKKYIDTAPGVPLRAA